MNVLLPLAVFTPLLGAMLAPFVTWALTPLQARAKAGYPLALLFAPGVLLVGLAARAGRHPATHTTNWVPQLGLQLTFRADGFSLLFAVLIAFIGILIFCYAASYLSPREKHGRFYSYLLLFGGSMLGLVLTDNLVALFAFWEITSISSFLLIGFWDSRAASQDGAMKALIITAVGGLGLLVAVALLIIAGGTVNISELDLATLRGDPYFYGALVALLLAAFTKSAQLPFHLWLPTAMEAPTPVSAFLHSATMVKAGVVLVAKLGFLFVDTPFQSVIMYVGLVTMFWGSFLAIRQTDLKALLAFSTVSQLGILMSLYGAGYPFAATAHLINHAAFKAALFMIVGIIDHELGSRDLSRLSGLRHKLPITFILAIPVTLSMAGLPPLGGFISKELFYESMFHEGFVPMFITVTGSMMTFAYSFKFLSVFWGDFRADKAHVHEASAPFWLPVLPLSGLAVLFGIIPALPSAIVAVASHSLGFHAEHLHLWHGFSWTLLLSIVTWLGGTIIVFAMTPFIRFQHWVTPHWNANTIYYGLVTLVERLAYHATALTQGSTFASHLRYVLLPLAGAYLLLGVDIFPEQLSSVSWEIITVALLVVGSCLGVVLARTRLSAILFMGLAGYSSTLAFVFLRAPDLALTQLLIETVSIILFLSVFRYLPLLTRHHRSRLAFGLDVPIAIGTGLTVFSALLAVQMPVADRIQDYFVAFSKSVGGGNNVVNVILVDFRGYDTMGEITVLSIVSVAILALLKLMRRQAPRRLPGQVPAQITTQEDHPETVSHTRDHASTDVFFKVFVFPINFTLIIIGLHLFLRGHNAPGGGFIAGLVIAVAALIARMANTRLFKMSTRVLVPIGLLVAASTGIVPMLYGLPFLTSRHGETHVPLLGAFEWATASIFDLGVFLVVIGVTLTIIDLLSSRGNDTLAPTGTALKDGRVPRYPTPHQHEVKR
jgi:NADH:ubiquinone oxidoreductase subunit 5 (subunit L)/multisubunit Na+/H+ antiporter MnhA subunit